MEKQPTIIRNCDFKFKCTRTWDSLTEIEGRLLIRHRTACDKQVHWVNNDRGLATARPEIAGAITTSLIEPAKKPAKPIDEPKGRIHRKDVTVAAIRFPDQ